MRPATLARLALTGSRTDTLRIVFTGASGALAALILLAAAAVAAVPEAGGDYGVVTRYRPTLLAEDGLRPGIVATLLLLAVPVLALAGQCIRFGSPARDRRLAALRLSGATPGQAVLVAAGETAGAALLGSLSGCLIYLVGRWALDRPDFAGQRSLPTDVLPSLPVLAGIVLLVPLVGGLAGAFLLRKVIVTPLGVVRRTRDRRPSVLPGALIIAGVFAPFVLSPLGGWLRRATAGVSATVVLLALMLLVLAAVLGVILGTGWIAYTTGRLLRRYARRPAALLAGRQLMADPWSGSRTFAALLAAVIVGAGVSGYRAELATQFAVEDELARRTGSESGYDTAFYFGAIDLVDLTVAIAVAIAAAGILIALAEGVVSRRRAYAILVATGVPRRTLGGAIAWQTLAPLIPATLVALIVGVSLVRAPGTTVSSSITSRGCADSSCPETVVAVTRQVPLPLVDLAVLGAGTLAIMALVAVIGFVLLRMSTDPGELRAA
ncbi:FtsX-like permease family protein [Krasilnikovia cinnamomea]|uniref:FtsX-like permease family protein n=1 Tax=Krasilnikovia cinnamomea TaxID=349313 RepID=A0A4Q7ZM20_9ACTN|nr:FtsX-like permease family protein [Krasilnikovia cinnamomea]RZU51443.1 FtsX-like permease family protein [Krasilnikovia cinnamomea]